MQSFLNFYTRYILNRPIFVILALLGLFSYLGFHARDFRLDASADSLILENDADYKSFREINKTYGTSQYLLMTYKPKGDLFSPETLRNLGSLRDELKEIKRVGSVFTILDVPLLRNPPVPIKELISNIKNLENPEVDLQLARAEIAGSPIYQELLVSTDMKMTAHFGTVVPGWYLCDGAAISRTIYANLFAVIGTDYGVGDGSTTFNVPDMAGKFPIGVDDGGDTDFDTVGKTGGEKRNARGSGIPLMRRDKDRFHVGLALEVVQALESGEVLKCAIEDVATRWDLTPRTVWTAWKSHRERARALAAELSR